MEKHKPESTLQMPVRLRPIPCELQAIIKPSAFYLLSSEDAGQYK
jgi:hypothetical protein